MKYRKVNNDICLEVAKELGINVSDVHNTVRSFFGAILSESRKLPFNDRKKIFRKNAFDKFCFVQNIPSIGRIGPSYSRYLQWRANEANCIPQRVEKRKGNRLSDEDIELIADAILSGKEIPEIKKKRGNELFERVWIVDECGKKQARQVIIKDKDNVQN